MYSLAQLDAPILFLVIVAFGLGAIIGSFLNVVIYRFHTGKSLSGRSHCMTCGKGLCWYHLFPLLSYIGLRGRCGYCGASFTPRYFAVELLTASLFSLVILQVSDIIEVGLLWAVVSVLVMILVYDLRHMIIPDEWVVALTLLVVVREGYRVVVLGLPWFDALSNILWPLFAAAFFFSLWYFSQGRWIGFGDVKLVVPLGILVGASSVFSLVVLSFWIGAVVSVALLGVQKLVGRGKPALRFFGVPLTMKSAVPFAPFLIAGCVIVFFFEINVIALFYNDLFY